MDERITELENKVKNLMNNNIKESPKTTNLKGLAAYNARAFPYISNNLP